MPARGTYRVFVEFYRDDRRHVAAYTVAGAAMTETLRPALRSVELDVSPA